MSAPRVWQLDNGIICIDFGLNGRVSFDTAFAANEAHRQISLEPAPVLILAKKILSAEYEAQRYASTERVCEVVSAMAIVLESFLARHLGNMFIAYHRPPYPTRLFKSEAVATRWLLEQPRPQ